MSFVPGPQHFELVLKVAGTQIANPSPTRLVSPGGLWSFIIIVEDVCDLDPVQICRVSDLKVKYPSKCFYHISVPVIWVTNPAP